MGEREERRKRSARATKVAPPLPVVQAKTWMCSSPEHRGTLVETVRGEACGRCGKRLLEG